MPEVTPRPKRAGRRPQKRRRDYMAQCDKLAGAIVRGRGRCENPECKGQRGALQWAHGFSRSYHETRHDLDLSWCLCAGCHHYYTHHPLEWEEWMVARLGRRRYNAARRRALEGGPIDWLARRAELEDLARRAGVIA